MTTLDIVASGKVRSFVDLRAFATAASIPSDDGADAWLSARAELELPAGPVQVAALALTGEGRIERLAADEFVIVLEGTVSFESEGARLTAAAGRSVVLPSGLSFTWSAAMGTRAIVMRCTGAPGALQLLPIDEAALLEPSGAPLAALLVGPTPSCRNHTDYRSDNGEFVCGTWDSTPYHRRAMPYRHYELMHLLDGAVTFEDGAGRIGTFHEGDIFLVEQGAECSWLSETHVKKVYAIYRPA
ncbi:hypothetical protein GCM10009087_54930 [Sphingomonas oligophenolica]|uniref:Cupin domain-containing protein n=1 Tax=Sphingomonas oligophenolica TaxID=301154 RepID=A0ABU9Y546_9SPHN